MADMDNMEKNKKEEKPRETALTKLYDKLPFTFRQVDIFVKVMFGVILILLVYGIIKGNLG